MERINLFQPGLAGSECDMKRRAARPNHFPQLERLGRGSFFSRHYPTASSSAQLSCRGPRMYHIGGRIVKEMREEKVWWDSASCVRSSVHQVGRRCWRFLGIMVLYTILFGTGWERWFSLLFPQSLMHKLAISLVLVLFSLFLSVSFLFFFFFFFSLP